MRPWDAWAVRGAAVALAAAGLGHTLWHGVAEPGTALAFAALVALGELARRDHHEHRAASAGHLPAEDRRPAPLGSAAALTYALLGEAAGHPTRHGALQTVAVVFAAALAAAVPYIARGGGHALDHVARRVLTVAFAAACFQPLHDSGRLEDLTGRGPCLVGFLLALLGLTSLCDAVLAAALARAGTGWPYGPLLRDELRAQLGIGSAICATCVVMALGVAVAGLWALPVFSVPLLLTQMSFHRITEIRVTYRQTITSLARATEIAGYTRPGHARRVAALSCAVGRELGLSERELTVLEYAALMHDIGQLSLVDPVPAGATAELPAAEARRIAELGGEVARRTGVPAEVAVVVELQADPYRRQPVAARIVRTVNAYDDLAAAVLHPGGSLAALEQLRLGTGRDHHPEVVESLARVLARGGRARVVPARPG
ncbi:HD-GYP domain-containing protein [Streptomyces goshikiensis]|uniref:HD-GYP domain-containing protein n=1 Tax=Streptomyces TaxID=1883 RepID=UPI00094049B3|nr:MULTISPECIES: HD domain-containing protein [Streptomyces]MBP0936201.1 HD domain-containing protein [Streptomyces sp. KCTC 0041BP]OKI29406.1 metal-dependent phosphohydrolase [Streptomyces sp. CB03578]PJN14407.1 HD domain-containing protein [Streptomyces sp. CB02120-2]WBY22001.1 HD domain-containing protein [Streptomyces goshikiensis]GHD57504.1 lipoprotein [Streptomyces goshikiensis]